MTTPPLPPGDMAGVSCPRSLPPALGGWEIRGDFCIAPCARRHPEPDGLPSAGAPPPLLRDSNRRPGGSRADFTGVGYAEEGGAVLGDVPLTPSVAGARVPLPFGLHRIQGLGN